MKHLINALTALLLCLALPLCALAQGLEQAEPLTGESIYPKGASAEQANLIFRYSYPQFAATSEADLAINAYYQAINQDMQSAMLAQMPDEADLVREEGMPPATSEISYQVTLSDERYVSVTLTQHQFIGNADSDAISANTFARDGMYAGQPITLSQVLGLEQEGDELSTQESTAEKLAYYLVWQIIQAGSQNVDGDYLDGLSEESLRAVFSPETDFYLDDNGNVVFFIQAGAVAGEVAGILTFPFAPAELLSAIKQPR